MLEIRVGGVETNRRKRSRELRHVNYDRASGEGFPCDGITASAFPMYAGHSTVHAPSRLEYGTDAI